MIRLLCLSICLVSGIQAAQPRRASATGISDDAYPLLHTLTQANRAAFHVYQNSDAGVNKSFPSGFFPAGPVLSKIHLDSACVHDPTAANRCSTNTARLDRTRGTVVRVTFDPLTGAEFVGVNWEEPENFGVLGGGSGYDLTGATRVCFDALSPSPGLKVEFSVGQKRSPYVSFPDTWTSTCLQFSSLGLAPQDLVNVHFPFSVGTNAANAPTGGTVLLDNIRFEPVPTAQQSALSFPLANEPFGIVPAADKLPGRVEIPPDQVAANLTTIYESSLVLLLQLARGTAADLADARLIADAFVYALAHDNQGLPLPPAPDTSRGLHSAYASGDAALRNNQGPSQGSGLAGQVRLAGFSIASNLCGPSHYCLVLDGATGGNNAFAMLALTAAYRQFNDIGYLNAARTIGNWIHGNLLDTTGTGYGGYYLGYPDRGEPKVLQTGKSIENNADLFRAFDSLAVAADGLGLPAEAAQWRSRSRIAGDFVMAMFDQVQGRFHAGTVPSGTPPSAGIAPTGLSRGNDVINVFDFLDAQTFTTLAMAASPTYRGAIDWRRPVQWMLDTYKQTVTAGGMQFRGFHLVAPAQVVNPNGIAWEFTGQAVAAMRLADALYGQQRFEPDALIYLAEIRKAQLSAPFADTKGVVAATLANGDALPPREHCLTTPFQCIATRVGLAATTWAMLADLNVNPFTAAVPSNVPTITAPARHQVLANQNVSLAWTQPGGATGYGLKVTQGTSEVYRHNLSGGSTLTNTILLPAGHFVFWVRACTGGAFADTDCGTYASVPFWVLLPPSALSAGLSPRSGIGSSQVFTFTFTDTAPVTDRILNVLINNAIDGRQACYVALVPTSTSSGTIYLVNDNGDAGGPFAGSMPIPGTGSVSNSQCTIHGAGSSMSTTGGTITLLPNITFHAQFAGNKVIYLAARNNTGDNTGWLPKGVWRVPGSAPGSPEVVSLVPGAVTGNGATLTATITDNDGFADLDIVNFLINRAIDGRQACYIAVIRATGQVVLVNDGGDAGGPFSGSIQIPGLASVSNSQCTVNASLSSVTGSGNTLTVTINFSFSPAFGGDRVIYMAARGPAAQNTGWQAMGALRVQ
ncbi:MAG: hypothetical protein R2762_26775 [Bryobacteraceae bacterium]